MTSDVLNPRSTRKAKMLITMVVDVSGSMEQSGGITELNNALQKWAPELRKNVSLSSSAEIAMVSFGGDVAVVDSSGRTTGSPTQPYVPVSEFRPPELVADGITPMVAGIQRAIDIMAVRRDELYGDGIQMSYRPLIYLVTDGMPTDETGQLDDRWRGVASILRQHEDGAHLLFFAIGVRGAREDVLAGLAPKAHYMLDNLNFDEVLKLVSTSIGSVQGTGGRESAEEIYGRTEEAVKANQRMEEWLRQS